MSSALTKSSSTSTEPCGAGTLGGLAVVTFAAGAGSAAGDVPAGVAAAGGGVVAAVPEPSPLSAISDHTRNGKSDQMIRGSQQRRQMPLERINTFVRRFDVAPDDAAEMGRGLPSDVLPGV